MVVGTNIPSKLLEILQITVFTGFCSLFFGAAFAGQCTERKWREDYPRSQEPGLICDHLTAHKIFYIFSRDKDCAFELYYRNGRILAQSYVVTRYIDHLDFDSLRLDRKSLQLKDGLKTHANCRVSDAQKIISEYNEDVLSQLKKNRF